jgi:hypothetical protein
MSNPSHFDLGQQIGHLTTLIGAIPARLDRLEKSFNDDIGELRGEIQSLKEQRSWLVGVGVGIGLAVSFVAGLLSMLGHKIGILPG